MSIFPMGAARGSTTEITVTGADLDEARALVFSTTNIGAVTKGAGKFEVTVVSNASVGYFDVRVAGRFGLSNPRTFVVSDSVEVVQKDGNQSMASAMDLPKNTVANGQVQAMQSDWYKFSLQPGQRVIIECETARIDSRLEPVLFLYDARGREIARERKTGLLDFTATDATVMHLKLGDLLHRGGSEYFYRLAARTTPHIDFIIPSTAPRGRKSRHVVYGRNLPGGIPAVRKARSSALEKLEVEIESPPTGQLLSDTLRRPTSAVIEGFEYRLESSNGLSNPFSIALSDATVVVEEEPNNQTSTAQKLAGACEVDGGFYPAGDIDCYEAQVKSGEVYRVEVVSHRAGLATDPFLWVQHISTATNGAEKVIETRENYDVENVVGPAEFRVATRDAMLRLDVKQEGLLRIHVRDLFNSTEPDARRRYRLSLRKEEHGYTLIALPKAPPPARNDSKELALSTVFLRRGETIPIEVLAVRKDGFDKAIAVDLEGLPSSITAQTATIESGKSAAIVMLTALDSVQGWHGPVTIKGRSETRIQSAALGGTLIRSVEDPARDAIEHRLTHGFYAAVSEVESAPLSIATATNGVWECNSTGKLSIPLSIIRRGDFQDAFKLKIHGSKAFESAKDVEVSAKATNAVVEIDAAAIKLPLGEHRFYLQAQTKGKYRNNPEAASKAEEVAKAAEKTFMDLAARLTAAKETLAAITKGDIEAQKRAGETVAELESKTKSAEAHKAATAGASKEAAERSKPREVTYTVYSPFITVRVFEEKKVAASASK